MTSSHAPASGPGPVRDAADWLTLAKAISVPTWAFVDGGVGARSGETSRLVERHAYSRASTLATSSSRIARPLLRSIDTSSRAPCPPLGSG